MLEAFKIVTQPRSSRNHPQRGAPPRDQLGRGMVLCAPGAVTAHSRFEAEILSVKTDEGGRRTPFFSGYQCQFFARTASMTGNVTLPEGGPEMVVPGDNATIAVALVGELPLEKGLRFAMREGGKTIGHGVVTKVVE